MREGERERGREKDRQRERDRERERVGEKIDYYGKRELGRYKMAGTESSTISIYINQFYLENKSY